MGQVLEDYITEISDLMQKQMRVRGRDLRQQTRRAGRRLPRRIRRDLAYLNDSATMAKNPKLGRMVDLAKVRKAHASVIAFLAQLDPRAAMWNAMLNIAASISLALIVTFTITIYVLVQRGFI